jgi:hypothetical protein
MDSGMDHDPFRPHWTHGQCGGVVTGVDDLFKCLKCNASGNAVGALLPANITNSVEYFACNPALEVQLVDPNEPPTAQLALDPGYGISNDRLLRGIFRRLMLWRW